MELLIGCGKNRDRKMSYGPARDWSNLVTLDMNEEHKPDYVHDLEKLPLPFEADSCNEIHAYDTLEHTGKQGDWRFFFDQFADFWRVLKPGGLFFLLAPHPEGIWAFGDPGHTRVLSIENLGFLDQARYSEVGKTAMTDYRPWYKADFHLLAHDIERLDGKPCRFMAVLQAIKPARSV